jgi:hypothetical protein
MRSIGSRRSRSTPTKWKSRHCTRCWRPCARRFVGVRRRYSRSSRNHHSTASASVEQESRNGPRSADFTRRGKTTARWGAGHEHVGASLRRPAHARSHHRRPRAVLPARRDAADPERTRALGHAPDRHPRTHDEGQGELESQPGVRPGRSWPKCSDGMSRRFTSPIEKWRARPAFVRQNPTNFGALGGQPAITRPRQVRAEAGAPGRVRTCGLRLRRMIRATHPTPLETIPPDFSGFFEGRGNCSPPQTVTACHTCVTPRPLG